MIYPMVKIGIMTKEELREWREKHNLTQTDLGNLLGVSYVSVARWEIGTRKIPSFLHLALEALENRKGGAEEVTGRKSRKKGGEKSGLYIKKKKSVCD
jgi:transcriptional regulator with XRE-family HTH domain